MFCTMDPSISFSAFFFLCITGFLKPSEESHKSLACNHIIKNSSLRADLCYLQGDGFLQHHNLEKSASSFFKFPTEFLIGFRVRVIKFIFFCIGVTIFPTNVVKITIRAMLAPDHWQGVKGDSF